MRRLVLIALALLVAALVVQDGALATLLGAGALVVAGVAWFESGADSTRELAVIATLAAAASAGRVLFAAVPGVQPVTVIAIVAGASLGLRAGVATGALAAFVSNLFLGQGIWTPQQMLGWGVCGAAGALLAPVIRNRWALAAVAAVLGFAFSASMDVWLWYGFAPHTVTALAAVLGRGLWAAATTRFILAQQSKAGGFSWGRGGQADSNDTAAALEALRVARVHGAPVRRAVRFLRSFQRRDGGFELSRGRGSDAQSTAWAIQGLLAAGVTPPRSAFAYLARMKRPDGSYRYSAKYVATPVWVTSQVLAALSKKPFPL